MNARTSLLFLTMLTPCLAGCEDSVRPVAAVLSQGTPAARKAEIRRQLAPICPAQLTDEELDRAADWVEKVRDKGAVWIAGRLGRMNAEAKICRGLSGG
jgi:hypothetical protein